MGGIAGLAYPSAQVAQRAVTPSAVSAHRSSSSALPLVIRPDLAIVAQLKNYSANNGCVRYTGGLYDPTAAEFNWPGIVSKRVRRTSLES